PIRIPSDYRSRPNRRGLQRRLAVPTTRAPLKTRAVDQNGALRTSSAELVRNAMPKEVPNARLKRVESRIFQHALYVDERLLRRFQLTLWALARRKPCRFNGSGTTCAGFSQESWCITLSFVWARMDYRTLLHLANSILFPGSAVSRSRG